MIPQFIIQELKDKNLYDPLKRFKDRLYYPFRDFSLNKKMMDLYYIFVKRDDLVFDIGAAHGNRTRIFLMIGAKKVITIEPTSYFYNYLKKKFEFDKEVILINKAVSDKEGEKEITIFSDPAFSTLDNEEVKDVLADKRLKNLGIVNKEKVKTIKIDSLIKKYGMPDFVKMDIEGHEETALKGLTKPLKALSFEYHTRHKEKALGCITLLTILGTYEFNYSMRESMKLVLNKWVSKEEIIGAINSIPQDTDFGDIYARLI